MPTKKALTTAEESGFIAAGHNATIENNPYTNIHAVAYYNAWRRGWWGFQAWYKDFLSQQQMGADEQDYYERQPTELW
jgi:hypothetical protein